MPVKAITDNYTGEVKDRRENFGDQQIVYVGWDRHLMFPAPFAFLVPRDMPFSALMAEVLPVSFSVHPDWSQINWDQVQWLLNGASFTPNPNQSLLAQGIDHKSVLRFQTPELKGFQDAGV